MKENQQELRGLSTEEVQQRISEGKVNTASTVKTKSIKRIFIDNICTVFNGINVLLFILLLLVGSYKNLLFIGVVLFNTSSVSCRRSAPSRAWTSSRSSPKAS